MFYVATVRTMRLIGVASKQDQRRRSQTPNLEYHHHVVVVVFSLHQQTAKH